MTSRLVKVEPKPRPEPESSQSSSSPDPATKKKKTPRSRIARALKRCNASPGLHRRSREGCFTCRVRRKKCDEITPKCTACSNLQLTCEYDMPYWWQNVDERRRHKDRIKASIRTTNPKLSKTKQISMPPPPPLPVHSPPIAAYPVMSPNGHHVMSPNGCHVMSPNGHPISSPNGHPTSPPNGYPAWSPHSHLAMSPNGHLLQTPNEFASGFVDPSSSPPQGPSSQGSYGTSSFSPTFLADTPRSYFDSTPLIPAPQWTPLPPQYPAFPTPQWEYDIKTETQTYIDGFRSSMDSTTSTFGTWDPATPTMMPPSDSPSTLTKLGKFGPRTDTFSEDSFDPNFFEYDHKPVNPEHPIVISYVDDCDRPLLNHFLDNVTPFVFSVFDARQKGSSLNDVVLPQLENNIIYLHTCLSTAALHLKITEHIQSEEIDSDIIRHRVATISALVQAIPDESADPSQALEATLAVILFQSAVGNAEEDNLPNIPWQEHFQAVVSIIDRVQARNPDLSIEKSVHREFNLTLTYWIDILGATALRRVPVYSDLYRERFESGETSGLAELMGCDDRIMYLISEIACLDALKQTMDMSEATLCQHIANLGERLSQTELGPAEVASVYTPGIGAIRPQQLSRNLTAIFRFAARIYLCSLVPEFDQYAEHITGLVDKVVEAMGSIPTGPQGFDRALVWPLMVAGAVSTPNSAFRAIFTQRSILLGPASGYGSYGRIRDLLEDVWHINDERAARGVQANATWRDVLKHKGIKDLII